MKIIADGLALEEKLQKQINSLPIDSQQRKFMQDQLKQVRAHNEERMAAAGVSLTPDLRKYLLEAHKKNEVKTAIESSTGPINELAAGLAYEHSLKEQISKLHPSDPQRVELEQRLEHVQQ